MIPESPIVTALYVPADRPDRFEKAAASGADLVIVDLEDAVAPSRKEHARTAAADWLAEAKGVLVEVRVNSSETPWHQADLAAVRVLAGLSSVRLPKVESASQVRTAIQALEAPRLGLCCLLESALGVEAAYEIASAHQQVSALALGEADLSSDLGVAEDGLTWARSRVVVGARAAGLPAPMMSAYTNVTDLDGLAESCRQGRRLGFVGRTAVHPRQLSVIRAAFCPTSEEVERAHRVLSALEQAQVGGLGVVVLPDGSMVDPAMIGRAQQTLALAKALADQPGPVRRAMHRRA